MPTSTPLPPPDEDAHTDGRLMHDLTVVNTQLGRYVLRFLDEDANRKKPISLADERSLANRLAEAAEAIRARATRRDQHEQP